jgi:hypothetical protein
LFRSSFLTISVDIIRKTVCAALLRFACLVKNGQTITVPLGTSTGRQRGEAGVCASANGVRECDAKQR